MTKRVRHGNKTVIIKPNENLVLLVKFSISMILCLSAVEVACIVELKQFSDEVFSAITCLLGTVTGVLVSHHY
jgi:hypothetical protein